MNVGANPGDWQFETVSAFVRKQKRERYCDKVSSPKKRKEFVAGLAHFADFDPRYIVRIPASCQHADKIEQVLRSKGAPDLCLIISEWDKLDLKSMPLREGLKSTIGSQMGTIICCIPGRLAFFESEDERYILERTS